MTDVLPKLSKVLTEGPFKEKILSLPTTPFYLKWLSILEMTSATRHSPTHAKVSFRFPVQSEYLNPSGTLHGAAQCLFFDVCTTFCLGPIARAPDFWTTFGVTRSLNVNYLRPAKEGEVLLLECETVDVGKRLGLLKGVLKRERDGAVVSTCEHTVYNVDADVVEVEMIWQAVG